jgi:hypothetical protein
MKCENRLFLVFLCYSFLVLHVMQVPIVTEDVFKRPTVPANIKAFKAPDFDVNLMYKESFRYHINIITIHLYLS